MSSPLNPFINGLIDALHQGTYIHFCACTTFIFSYVCLFLHIFIQLFIQSLSNIYSEICCLLAELVKSLPAMQETLVQFLGSEDPLEKG